MSTSLIDLHLKTLEVLDNQLTRIHAEMKTYTSVGNTSYMALINQANTIIAEITRLSKSIEISAQTTEN